MIKTCDCGGLYATERETFAGKPCYCPFPRTTSDHDPSKRSFLAVAGLGATGFALGTAFTAPACSAKSVSAEIIVVETFLKVVAVEIPNQSAIITKILKVADDFNADYQRGDFANAAAIFATLETDTTQLIADLGVNVSQRVKIALVLIDAAITAIGELLKSQKTAVIQGMIATPEKKAQAMQIEKRADKIDKLFRAIH